MKRIDEVIAIDKNEFGFEKDGFDIARRDVTTIGNLIDHIHSESRKAYELMSVLKDNNRVYEGNIDVLDQLSMITLTSSDAHDFLLDDKKALGILNERSEFDD